MQIYTIYIIPFSINHWMQKNSLYQPHNSIDVSKLCIGILSGHIVINKLVILVKSGCEM